MYVISSVHMSAVPSQTYYSIHVISLDLYTMTGLRIMVYINQFILN